MARLNLLCLEAELVEHMALRTTPAGVEVAGAFLRHASTQLEADHPRQVIAEMEVVAMGPLARILAAAPLGGWLSVEGFLAARRRNSRSVVLHLNKIEFTEGQIDGIQAQVEEAR